MKYTAALVLFIAMCSPLASFSASAKTTSTTPSLERLLYYTDTDSGYASLKKNATKIDILSSQSFTFDAEGTITADVSPRMVKVLEAHTRIKVMPLIENEYFDLTVAHAVLTNPAAQDKLIKDMIAIGTQNHYWGWQMDMEHMDAIDRPLYTAFSQKVGKALHEAGLKYSIAVTAKVSDNPADYSAKSWNKWAGIFDYAPLAEACDFLSIMLYDQDDSVGPVSTLTWYTEVVNYALKTVPKEKLSIGIPFYGWEWVPETNKRVSSHTYKYVLDQIKNKTVQSTVFNDVLGTGIMSYTVKVNGKKEKRVLWYENIESFKLKYDILKKAHVRGFSAWAIGQEDARVWTLLPVRK